MQLYALDLQQKPVLAKNASKGNDYACLECGGVVRARAGTHRQPHFYHLHPIETCRQSGKSMTHLQVQYHLLHLFEEQCRLEVRFPQLSRIADVVWEKHKLIFEIQCSPIKAQEVLARNRDYESLGYRVIWILHDRCFNQWRVSAAEMALRESLFYFTDINAEGKGKIYDQCDLIANGLRSKRLAPLSVKLSSIKLKGNQSLFSAPQILQNRWKQDVYYFEGDLLDHWLSGKQPNFFAHASEWETKQTVFSLKKLVDRFVIKPYLTAFGILLEKACK